MRTTPESRDESRFQGTLVDVQSAESGEPARAWLGAFLASGCVPDALPVPANVVHHARVERVHLLFARALHKVGPLSVGLSDELASELALDLRVAAAQDAARGREVARVIAGLDGEGCAPIVIKGAALAHSHYEQPWLRPRLDTDVLVDPVTHERAARVFARLGYERPAFVSGRLVMYQEMFVKSEAGGLEHVFDLHWRIANPQVVSRALTHSGLVERGTWAEAPDGPFRVPSAADALVLACVHRAAHHHDTRNLLWLYDIHLLAQGLSDEDWARVLSTARHGAVAALCARGLALAAVCFGTRVPDATAAALAAPTKEASRLFLADDVRPVARLASDLRALGSRDGVRLLREIAFPPRTYMRAAYGGTGWLPWLYVRRVGRGVGKWMRPFRSVGC